MLIFPQRVSLPFSHSFSLFFCFNYFILLGFLFVYIFFCYFSSSSSSSLYFTCFASFCLNSSSFLLLLFVYLPLNLHLLPNVLLLLLLLILSTSSLASSSLPLHFASFSSFLSLFLLLHFLLPPQSVYSFCFLCFSPFWHFMRQPVQISHL